MQQIAESSQSTICLVGKHLLGKHFAKLDAFLIEGIDIPGKSLEHDLVFKVGKQSAKCSWCQLIADNNGRRSVAGKSLVRIFIIVQIPPSTV